MGRLFGEQSAAVNAALRTLRGLEIESVRALTRAEHLNVVLSNEFDSAREKNREWLHRGRETNAILSDLHRRIDRITLTHQRWREGLRVEFDQQNFRRAAFTQALRAADPSLDERERAVLNKPLELATDPSSWIHDEELVDLAMLLAGGATDGSRHGALELLEELSRGRPSWWGDPHWKGLFMESAPNLGLEALGMVGKLAA